MWPRPTATSLRNDSAARKQGAKWEIWLCLLSTSSQQIRSRAPPLTTDHVSHEEEWLPSELRPHSGVEVKRSDTHLVQRPCLSSALLVISLRWDLMTVYYCSTASFSFFTNVSVVSFWAHPTVCWLPFKVYIYIFFFLVQIYWKFLLYLSIIYKCIKSERQGSRVSAKEEKVQLFVTGNNVRWCRIQGQTLLFSHCFCGLCSGKCYLGSSKLHYSLLSVNGVLVASLLNILNERFCHKDRKRFLQISSVSRFTCPKCFRKRTICRNWTNAILWVQRVWKKEVQEVFSGSVVARYPC